MTLSNPGMRRAILVDLSGTLHVEDVAIPGAVEALKRLYDQSERYAIRFVTNTTKVSE
jgi:ribonucleotide monophosphatase NagD (HAD superfamily)